MNQVMKLKELTYPLKVLYVEDDRHSREQLSAIFEILFGQLKVAKEGMEGWELYEREGDFDLVITDIEMPRLDGIRLTERIKARNPLQRVVAVSAHDTNDYLMEAIRAGVDNFILKPLELAQFETALRSIARSLYHERMARRCPRDPGTGLGSILPCQHQNPKAVYAP